MFALWRSLPMRLLMAMPTTTLSLRMTTKIMSLTTLASTLLAIATSVPTKSCSTASTSTLKRLPTVTQLMTRTSMRKRT